MTKLSVNINKIATLRNARGGNNPNVLTVARDVELFGGQGITVHPRPDERHIRYQDVRDLRPQITTEFNIEGNPIDSFTELVLEVLPTQVTLVRPSRMRVSAPASLLMLPHVRWKVRKPVVLTAWSYTQSPMPQAMRPIVRLPSHPLLLLPKRHAV